MSRQVFSILLFVCVVFWTCAYDCNAQSVGLVLSGGGAKGIAHISVIKALEKYGIPIDFVAGTSMGAIVGGLYASGYTPDEMVEILKSADFRYWSTGQIPRNYYYYYKERYQKPSMINLRFFRQDSITKYRTPVSLVPPHSMDLGLLELFSAAGGKAGNNFDSLFIPFRCVAADIYEGKAVTFRNGELPSAVRASMTYPFYFQPIEIDGVLYFDGGIYNNFPFDIMIEDFNPDIIIGIKVSGEKQRPDEDNLLLQIENMVLGHTDYNLPGEKGILIDIDLGDVSVMEFQKYDEILEKSDIIINEYIDSIKSRIPRRVEYEEIKKRRDKYKAGIPDLKFNGVIVKGVKEKQIDYVINSIKHTQNIFGLEQLRSQYYKLVTDDKIERIYPRAIYDNLSGYFDLLLDIRSTSILETYIGGYISSSSINQGFAGFDYKYLDRQSYNLEGNVYFGRLYSSVLIRGRAEYPGRVPFFVDVSGSLNRLDFFSSSNDLFFEDVRPSYLIQNERSFKISAGFPVSVNRFFRLGYSYGNSTDDYYQVTEFKKGDTVDVTKLNMNVFLISTERNTANYLQYATKGVRYVFRASYIEAKEKFYPGSTSLILNNMDKRHMWFEASVKYEHYFGITKHFSLGTHVEGVISNKGFLSNYTSTKLDAFAFSPTPHSKTLYIESFRANSFAALGIKPIIRINDVFHWRTEAYLFSPYREVLKNPDDNTAYYGQRFNKFYIMASSSVVAHTRFGPVSVGLNYYDKDERRFYLNFNFGYVLFNPKIRE
jgi:NTE family protein